MICLNSYRKALSYLEKWFDFYNSIFKIFKSLNLDKNFNYFDIVPIINSFYIKVDISLLYDEISGFNEEFSELDSDIIKIPYDKLWSKMLEKGKYPNLYKIFVSVSYSCVQCIISIKPLLDTLEQYSGLVFDMEDAFITGVLVEKAGVERNESNLFKFKNQNVNETDVCLMFDIYVLMNCNNMIDFWKKLNQTTPESCGQDLNQKQTINSNKL